MEIRAHLVAVDRLTREDTRILKLERGAIRGHTCKVLVLERTGDRPLPTLEEVRGHMASRLDAAIRLRQRVVPTPLRVADPVWLDDPTFDINRHVTAVDDPAIEGRAGLEEVVGRLMCERLDRSRPLWHLAVIPRLDEDSMALVWRLHHCLADGTTCMRLGDALLWDTTADVVDAPPAEWSPAPAPGVIELLSRGLAEAARRHAPSLFGFARRARRQPRAHLQRASVTRELGRTAARTPLGSRVGDRRAVAFASIPLDAARAAGKAIDSAITVNDVVLAVIAGGIRAWLGRGFGPVGGIRVKIPVSLHQPDEGDNVGNRDSYFFVDLPVSDADVAGRALRINRETARRKLDHDADMLYRLGAHPFVERWAQSPRVFTFNVSNVRGPAHDLYVLGAHVREMYSLAEIAQQHALRIAVISMNGRLFIGLCADPEAVREMDVLRDGIEQAADELLAFA
jgi:diacylglycerol O-acyltransferase / wax synthase